MDVSLTIQSFIDTVHGLKMSFGINESVDCTEDNAIAVTPLPAKDDQCEEFWFRSTPFTFPKHQQLLLECCMCISAICLIMNLIVYSMVPKLRNTPGKCLMSLSLSLLLAIVTYLVSFHIEVSPFSMSCISTALIRLYSYLCKTMPMTKIWSSWKSFDLRLYLFQSMTNRWLINYLWKH